MYYSDNSNKSIFKLSMYNILINSAKGPMCCTKTTKYKFVVVIKV